MKSIDHELVFTEKQNDGILDERKIMKEQMDTVLKMNVEGHKRINELKV